MLRYRQWRGSRWGRERKKGERPDARTQETIPRVGLFLYTQKHVPGLFRLSSNILPAFVFLAPRRLTLFGGLARISSLLVLDGTYRAHERRMKSAGIEGAYVCCVGGASWTPHFPRISSSAAKNFLGMKVRGALTRHGILGWQPFG